jgi:hypothetical protein
VTPTPNPPPPTPSAPAQAPATTSTTVTSSTSSPFPATSTTPPSTGGLISVFLAGAVIAAIIGAVVNIALARRKSLEEERARVRTTFAEAFQTVAEYKEFPYAIRRRRSDIPAEERVRLSEALREVQAKLSYYAAWTKAESDDVGRAYEKLVGNLREIAGKACHDAWLAPATNDDKDMNFPPGVVDLSALKPDEEAFVAAARKHLREMLGLRRLVHRP